MTNLTKQFKSFERRVRLVRAWRGMSIGTCAGAAICVVWAMLDWRGLLYTEWTWMGSLVGVTTLFGAVISWFWKVSETALAISIDRRAGLNERLITATERWENEEVFDGAIRSDAQNRLSGLNPKRLFPMQMGRWQGASIALSALAAGFFVLGNTPIALSDENKLIRAELKKQGKAVERVTKENLETPEAKQEMSDEEKKLADELRKYQHDLEKARMTKEEALQKANDLSQKADEMMKDAAQASKQDLQQAQSVREQLEKSELQQNGMADMSPQMASMSDAERSEKLAQAKKQGEDLQKSINALKQKLDDINRKLANPKLSASEKKALESQKKDAEKELSKLQGMKEANANEQKALQLSKQAQEVFNKMMNDPIFKKLLEIERKLARDSDAAAKSGRPKLTDEERKKLKEELEKLAERLKDPTAMKEYLEALLKAMEEAKKLGRCNGVGIGLSGLPLQSIGGMSPPGPGSPKEDTWQGDNKQVYKLDNPAESKGKTTTSVISGNVREATGPQAYVEIKAPSLVGNRTSVPYQNVLPSYKKKAESALDRQQIPKEHQQRVKQYFESLTNPKKG